jgi:hypothetical protein
MSEVSQIAISAVQFYQSRGISKDAAVAIVSVLWYESKLKPGSQGSQSTETPGTLNPGGAYGIASWNGPRQMALSAFAQRKGLSVGELNTQLAFVLTESANAYHNVWAAITSTQNYSQIIPIFVAEYENPKDHQAEINAAMAFAGPLYAAIPAGIPQPAIPQLTPLPTIGAKTMPTIDPILIEILSQVFAGIIKHLSTTAGTTTAVAPTALPTFDPSTIAKDIAAELAKFIPGVKL